MPSTSYVSRTHFGLLPEPERNPASFVTSAILNVSLIALLLVLGNFANHAIQARKMESTQIVFPTTPPPEIVKVKTPPAPKVKLPPLPEPKLAKLDLPKIRTPKAEPKPVLKQVVMKENLALPTIRAAKPEVALAPQPKAAIAQAAAPALEPQQHPSVTPVHLGDLNGVRPNPNAGRPATVAALGNPYGGMQGNAEAPRGVVGSTGFGNGVRSGSSAGTTGKVASAGIPGGNGQAQQGAYGNGQRVASAGIPGDSAAPNSTGSATMSTEPKTTPPILLSHAEPQYTAEAKQMKIQGDVVLRVTITTDGRMVVHHVIHGLGHGLDESAMRSAPTYRFKPATQNGHAVDYETNIIIKFQTA